MGDQPAVDTGVAGAGEQYRKAAPAQPQASWNPWAPTWANEKDPSWEDVITMVVIPSNPGRIRAAAAHWRVLFDRASQVQQQLDRTIENLDYWKGAGGEAYRTHLTAMSASIKQFLSEKETFPSMLEKAAAALEAALAKIEIPDDMAHEVRAAQQDYYNSGNLPGKLTNGLFGWQSMYEKLFAISSSKWLDGLNDAARNSMVFQDYFRRKFRDWFSDKDEKAKAAYRTLAKDHLDTMDHIEGPNPIALNQPRGGDEVPFDPDTGLPDTGFGDGSLPGGSLPDTTMPVSDTSGLPGTGDLPGTDTGLPGSGAGFDPDDLGGTGLAGAGDGLGGTGLSPAGLGSGPGGLGTGPGGLGTGPGGLGSGAGGGGVGGVGRGAVGGVPGIGGIGAVGGAGNAAGSRGAAGGKGGPRVPGGAGMGIMPGGAGHGGGEGEDHSTWLQEDEDVWGTDTDAPPGLLA
jgi:hypothetical protein